MNKVICDICGTAYPDTASKCPICGYAKTATETTAAGAERRSSEGYTAVKGGRFSKQNVRKRNGGKTIERTPNSDKERRSHDEEGGNTGLILVVIFLLVAIVAVVIYIGLRVFRSPDAEMPQPTGTSQVTQPSTAPSDPTSPTTGIVCESLQLSNQTIEFVNAGDTWTIQARPTPANTTDAVAFESSDPSVVTVDETGLLTAVNAGEATITVTCGEVTQTCQIKCSFEAVAPTDPTIDPTAPTGPTTDAPTNPTDPTTTDPTTTNPTVPAGPVDPNFTFEFNTRWKDEDSGKWDTSILEQGKTWKAYTNDLSVDPGAITWTSDDPSICTIQNGIVTGVAPGKTEVHATYGGKTYTCIVRCKFEVTDGGNTTPTTPAQPGNDATTAPTTPTVPSNVEFVFAFNYSVYDEATDKWDTTLGANETWKAYKNDLSVDPSAITWTTDNADVCTVKDGIVTAEGPGKTEIHATYGGKTYTCIVRVKAE